MTEMERVQPSRIDQPLTTWRTGHDVRPVDSFLQGRARVIQLPLCCQSCHFSPFRPDLLAVATAELFGIAGAGRLHVFSISNGTFLHSPEVQDKAAPSWQRSLPLPEGAVGNPWTTTHFEIASMGTSDAITDCAWSESNEYVIAAACGDGVTRLWDFRSQKADLTQIRGNNAGASDVAARSAVELRGHRAEVCGVDWSTLDRQLLLSSSWDGKAMMWDVLHLACVCVLPHSECVYAASFSPRRRNVVASVSADGRLRLFDLNSPPPPNTLAGPNFLGRHHGTLVCDQEAHGGCEVLCFDWSKYHENEIFTGGSNGSVRLWDLRAMAKGPLMDMAGIHKLAVRDLKCSPFSGDVLATASYDTNVKVTSIARRLQTGFLEKTETQGSVGASLSKESFTTAQQKVFSHHAEFVMGIDWSLFQPHFIASASWDRHTCLWSPLGDELQYPPLIRRNARQ
ncbi:WD domain, G-beta repeat-containing protein [Toxoplasma gondii TgCatPRC2]|uniref:Peroxin-7 n=11 Tax=Toxoplasma gondii TaxID=5811 RepID=S7UW00_TOXGG|nr:WD domain, G-beta repeat-containing protein [Toxoplasma gondii GT1]KAF4642980.1 WD domain, G-beta repeat-containing protein [Toxoplasma gondii]KFG41069.1 WD domain, G-beta repeat-containing protein [Toxoplasma gondii GAB2-2007-GAL-DOM2]KFG45422.1 WD domain, G-beta repeat-containing protein [Toxoplasma gondii p89]KFG53570.1 WD domain, G-beta repeat-containing protein [Toxoplasma gondii FOU]KFG62053.1 WD domain, G-beta repeat-containing protein [Toxoplasma gondii RUB]KFH06952.1 WD domain, G-